MLGELAPEAVRVRFPPSPTGNLHVGNVRSALFNWAFARHYGGTLVLRIEDTDLARNTPEGYASIIDALSWLGIDYDEGPGVGGEFGPYKQSERFDIYRDIVAKLRESGAAYDCFCTNEEVETRRKASGSKIQGYDGYCRGLSTEQRLAFESEGRTHVVRIRIPDGPIVFDDLVRGEVTFQPEHVPDFAIVRANGDPLYTLVNPVDDALMGITHVLRGEDLLSSTPRQIALYEALAGLGIGTGSPRFGHLPIVMGEGNKRLSKRDAGSGLAEYVERGFLPEGLLNYLALLGWGIAEDRDVFTMQEMAEAFDIRRVNPNPARFDLKKLEAINAAHMRLLSIEELERRLVPFLREADLIEDPPDGGGDPEDHRGQRADPRARRHPRRRRGHAGVPVPRRGRLRRGRRGQGAQRGRPRGRGRGPRGAGGPVRLDDRCDRRGPARQARRGARHEAPSCVRPGSGRRDGAADLPAAVRVPRAARS